MSLLTWILIGVIIVLVVVVIVLVLAIRCFLTAADSVLDETGWMR